MNERFSRWAENPKALTRSTFLAIISFMVVFICLLVTILFLVTRLNKLETRATEAEQELQNLQNDGHAGPIGPAGAHIDRVYCQSRTSVAFSFSFVLSDGTVVNATCTG